jgi:[CysO sulfur-carrier protein]-S-L-cysteine hydrolase
LDYGSLSTLNKKLRLARKHWLAMQRYVNEHAPLEACGLLAGKNNMVQAVLEIRNQAQSPIRFVMDPHEQLAAFNWIDSNELDLLAIFHSHPAGPEAVSETDIAEAAYAVVHIVCFRKNGGWRARGFWIEDGQASKVTLEFV